jgi:hypothetical protein
MLRSCIHGVSLIRPGQRGGWPTRRLLGFRESLVIAGMAQDECIKLPGRVDHLASQWPGDATICRVTARPPAEVKTSDVAPTVGWAKRAPRVLRQATHTARSRQ